MAKGDVVADTQSIANGGNLDFQPSAGVEDLIESVEGDVITMTKFYDGTNASNMHGDQGFSTLRENFNFIVDEASSGAVITTRGGISTRHLEITNGDRLRITNNSGATNNIGFGGFQTK